MESKVLTRAGKGRVKSARHWSQSLAANKWSSKRTITTTTPSIFMAQRHQTWRLTWTVLSHWSGCWSAYEQEKGAYNGAGFVDFHLGLPSQGSAYRVHQGHDVLISRFRNAFSCSNEHLFARHFGCFITLMKDRDRLSGSKKQQLAVMSRRQCQIEGGSVTGSGV